MTPCRSFWTPIRILINTLIFCDRGCLGSTNINNKIQKEFKLPNYKFGLLSSAFIVCYIIAFPIFTFLAKSRNPFKLIGVGLSIWIIGVFGCGFSRQYWFILICRMLVGTAEASTTSIGASYIALIAPANKRTTWLSAFFMCIPIGYAAGYTYGGLVGADYGWRVAFWGLAIIMLILATPCFFIKPSQIEGSEVSNTFEYSPNEDYGEEIRIRLSLASKIKMQISLFFKEVSLLLHNKAYIINVLGLVAYTFVFGVFAFWGPKAAMSIYGLHNADLIFGGLTVLCAIVGTLVGGLVVDYCGSTIKNSFKFMATTSLIGALLCLCSFFMKNVIIFLVLFSLGEVFLFSIQGPVNFVSLHCVPSRMSPLAMGFAVNAMHIFGDVPSVPLVGALQDHIKNWRTTALIVTSILFLTTIWFFGAFTKVNDSEDVENQIGQ